MNTNTRDGSCVVSLTGEMTSADANFFEIMAPSCNGGGVLLESKGGSLQAGLRLGELFRQRGMETAVAYDTLCASSCALAWLGGVKRNMFPTSQIGFHVAYTVDGGHVAESGLGNALVGYYLGQLGLPRSAIFFISGAAPTSMNWLNYRQVDDLGISINLLGEIDYGWIDAIRNNDPHYAEEAERQ